MATLNEVLHACHVGDIATLIDWKAANSLPNLQPTDSACPVFPHESAIIAGNLDVLRWLVEESGQHIDLTIKAGLAIRLAVAQPNTALLRWMLHDSGQDFGMSPRKFSLIREAVKASQFPTTMHLLFQAGIYPPPDVSTLLRLFVFPALARWPNTSLRSYAARFGLAEDRFSTKKKLIDAIRAQAPEKLEAAVVYYLQLKAFGLQETDAHASAYLLSDVCQQAVRAGVVTTLSQLDVLLFQSRHATSQLHRKM